MIWKTECCHFQKDYTLLQSCTTAPGEGVPLQEITTVTMVCMEGWGAYPRDLGMTNQREKGVQRGEPLEPLKAHLYGSAEPLNHHRLTQETSHTITDTGQGLFHCFHGCFLAHSQS